MLTLTLSSSAARFVDELLEAVATNRAVAMLPRRAASVCRLSLRTRRFGLRGACLAMALGLIAISSVPLVYAQSPGNNGLTDFSIPAQPLASALNRFGDATGSEVLYEGDLANGRISGSVQGRLAPAEALRRLLSGTGVSARLIAEGTFVLEPAPEPRAGKELPRDHQHYYALIQGAVLDALCDQQEGRPGNYRMITIFRIAPNGAVADLLRMGTSGKAETDELIDRTLRALKVREVPPRDFLQPVRLLFVPQGRGVNSGCDAAEARRARRSAP